MTGGGDSGEVVSLLVDGCGGGGRSESNHVTQQDMTTITTTTNTTTNVPLITYTGKKNLLNNKNPF